MGAAENEELIHYYKDRRAWLLEADETPPRLAPYSADLAARQVELPVPADERRQAK